MTENYSHRDSPEATRPDRRVRRTRDAIRRALISLMQEKGYDAVTVADLIDRADIGRSTFYTHYTDKQHVLYASLDELAAFLRTHREADRSRLFGFSLAFFQHVHEQRQLVQALLGRRNSTVVQHRIQHVLAELVREELGDAAPRDPAVPLDLVVDYVVGAYLALLARWADDTEPRSPRAMDAAFRRLVVPGVNAALRLPADRA